MPFGTITSTSNTFGSISGDVGANVPGTLSGSVGVPGPQGVQGIQGIQGPPGPAGPGSTWGGIAGTLSDQTDLQTALNAKANLAGPVFTGDARAVTPAFGDNDTSIATTAFVQSALLGGTAIARNLEVEVRNQSGVTVPAGSIVYISGATGNKPLITLAQANNDTNSAQTIGFVKTAIANNGTGYVIVRGELENIDTSSLTEGVQLYLSPTTAGTWTTTKPSAPLHLVYVGIVIRSHPTLGTILVAVQNGYELDELHDVAISSPTNGQVLKYNSTSGLWVNGTDVGGVAWGGITGTLSSQTDLQTALDGKYPLTGNPSGFITSSALTGYATESWVTAGFYPLTANPSGFITSSALTPYLTSATAASTYQTLSGMSSYLTTSAAASTYYPLTNPYNFITSAGLAGYATESWVTSGFYPLTGNPSSFLVSADIAGKANIASPALTGNVTITSNSTGAALFITQTGTGNILTLHDQASDTSFVAIDQNGKVSTIPSTTAGAGFNIAHGVAPTTFVDGDVWSTTGGLFWRQNAATKQAMNLGDTQTVSGNITFSNTNLAFGTSNGGSTTNVAVGATNSGATKAVNIGTSGVSGSTTNITVGPVAGASTTSIGNTTAASTLNLATGATLTATTKAVNIGTNGVAGSTTNITIGSTTGTSTTTLQGNTNGVTQTAGNNTTLLATTAFVQAAVPAFATLTEARQFSNTTKVLSPSLAIWSMLSADIIYIQRSNFTTTNVGSVQYTNAGSITTETRLASAAASSSRSRTFGPGQVDQSQSGTVRSNISGFLNFSLRTFLGGRSATFDITDPVLTMAFYYGKAEADGVGDLTRRGMGWKVTGGTGSRFLTLQVHNGTTLTSVTSSFAVTGGQAFDWDIISDGAGNVTLYVNGSSVATSSAGPTGLHNLTPAIWQEEYSTSGVPAITYHTSYQSRGRMAVINY